MTLTEISKTILKPESSNEQLKHALNQFALLCSEISNIEPNPSYNAWSEDTFLDQGVAINPNAAAYCIKDYQRTVVFIRGIYDALIALENQLGADESIKVLYAGCGPFATLLLPLLPLFEPDKLDVHLLDIHQQSLESVECLLDTLGLADYKTTLVKGDACHYQHTNSLDLIIVEVMQKALEQEPQFSVTCNLATQLKANGIFVPQEISVELCLAHLEEESEHYKQYGRLNQIRHPISRLIQLSASSAQTLANQVEDSDKLDSPVLPLGRIEMPAIHDLDTYQPLLLTHISVYGEQELKDYESSLTLPSRCFDLEPLVAGAKYEASYLLGRYPKIHWHRSD